MPIDKAMEAAEKAKVSDDQLQLLSNGYSLQNLADEIRKINSANGWQVTKPEEWGDPYKIPGVLALIHSEVSEALEAFRADDGDNFAEELADIVIRVLDLAPQLLMTSIPLWPRNWKRTEAAGTSTAASEFRMIGVYPTMKALEEAALRIIDTYKQTGFDPRDSSDHTVRLAVGYLDNQGRIERLERVAELADLVQSEELGECVAWLEDHEWWSEGELSQWYHDDHWPSHSSYSISAITACGIELDLALNALKND